MVGISKQLRERASVIGLLKDGTPSGLTSWWSLTRSWTDFLVTRIKIKKVRLAAENFNYVLKDLDQSQQTKWRELCGQWWLQNIFIQRLSSGKQMHRRIEKVSTGSSYFQAIWEGGGISNKSATKSHIFYWKTEKTAHELKYPMYVFHTNSLIWHHNQIK